jgi:hypothetical protein
MTFDNTITHPFFNQPEVLKADVLDIAEEFGRVFQSSEAVAQNSSYR